PTAHRSMSLGRCRARGGRAGAGWSRATRQRVGIPLECHGPYPGDQYPAWFPSSLRTHHPDRLRMGPLPGARAELAVIVVAPAVGHAPCGNGAGVRVPARELNESVIRVDRNRPAAAPELLARAPIGRLPRPELAPLVEAPAVCRAGGREPTGM